MWSRVWRGAACSVLALLVGCSSEIIHDVSEAEANEILGALQQRGLGGEKLRHVQGSKASYTVRVARADAVQAWRVLRDENLPRPERKGLGEVFGTSTLVPTATQERALIHHALAGELSKTLQSVAGVLEARVHVVLPARDPLAPADVPAPAPRASVLLRTSGPSPLSRVEVQQLVAGSVDAMKPEAVSVLIVSSHQQPPATATGALSRLGPFLVAESSRGLLRVTLLGALGLVLLLVAALLLLARRHRALQLRHRRAAPVEDVAIRSRDLESSLGLVARSLTGARPSFAPPEVDRGRSKHS
jgi:type III secretion protein J